VANISGADATSDVALAGHFFFVDDAIGAPTLTFDGATTGSASELLFNASANFSLANASFKNWATGIGTPGNAPIQIDGGHSGITLVGSSQDDIIFGGFGGDTLTGGGGADGFGFTGVQDGGSTITDFSSAQGDYLLLNHNGFAGLPATGNPTANEFVVGAGPTLASAQLVFNPLNETLSWYANGTGSSGAELAALTGVTTLSATNIHMF
jgi:Ca2+-binding RTX toxin-like protein